MSNEFDVVIVGGGLAGLVAGNRAAQLGRSVAVLEKGTEELYPCNSRFAFGAFHICRKDMMAPPDTLLKEIETCTAGFSRPDLAEAVARNSARVLQWLMNENCRFLKASPMTSNLWVAAPPSSRSKPGLEWKGFGPDTILRTLEANFAKRGGKLLRGTRARSLLMENRRCVGVITQTADGIVQFRARATIIADGGFQANADLVREHISPRPERVRMRGAVTGTGDGLTMARAVGAATVGLKQFYGHVLSANALTNDLLWPYPYMDELAIAGIVVDANGRRFVDEGRGGEFLANAIAGLDDPLSAVLIFDQPIWDGPGRARVCPPNPNLKAAGGTIHQADSLEQLASLAGMPAAALMQTVAEYNAAIDGARLQALTPPRTLDKRPPQPIRTAPYYAVPLCAGITHTMGGLVIDGNCRVLDTRDAPIAGLYAAGASTGGLEGGPEVGYVGGLAKSSITGLRAGEAAAE